jgi:hypothetical protein
MDKEESQITSMLLAWMAGRMVVPPIVVLVYRKDVKFNFGHVYLKKSGVLA